MKCSYALVLLCIPLAFSQDNDTIVFPEDDDSIPDISDRFSIPIKLPNYPVRGKKPLFDVFGSPITDSETPPAAETDSTYEDPANFKDADEINTFESPNDQKGITPSLDGSSVDDRAAVSTPEVSEAERNRYKEIFGTPTTEHLPDTEKESYTKSTGGENIRIGRIPPGSSTEHRTSVPTASDSPNKEKVCLCSMTATIDQATRDSLKEIFGSMIYFSSSSYPTEFERPARAPSSKNSQEDRDLYGDIFGSPEDYYKSYPTMTVNPPSSDKAPSSEVPQADRDRINDIFGSPDDYYKSNPTKTVNPPSSDKVCLCVTPAREVNQAEKDNLRATLGNLIDFNTTPLSRAGGPTVSPTVVNTPPSTIVNPVPLTIEYTPPPTIAATPSSYERLTRNTSITVECYTRTGDPGVCVPYYLCRQDSGKVVTDGEDLLDNRLQDDSDDPVPTCSKELDVCCLLELQDNYTPSPQPVTGWNTCGWSDPGVQALRRIGMKSVAEFGEFPWMVAILNRSAATTWTSSEYVGGGSIIHPSVVLTAYHKVQGMPANELKCRAGEWDTQTDKEIFPHQERNVKKIVGHAAFYRPAGHNSIALLILEAPYDPTGAPHIGVACLTPNSPPKGIRCLSMGWGNLTHGDEKTAVVLKKVEQPTFLHNVCQARFRKTRLGRFFKLDKTLMCAGGEEGQDTCNGDGGSPLVCPMGEFDQSKEPTRFAIMGMVAWGLGCGGRVPAAYVNVPYFYDWVGEHMKAEGFNSSYYTYE